jgi:hypothetical protein
MNIVEAQRSVWLPPAIAAVMIGLCIRVVLLFVTPVESDQCAGHLSSYNDEIAHINYVKYILENHRLPGQIESIQAPSALSRGFYENYQPPLYYTLVAGIGNILGCSSVYGLAILGRTVALLTSLACLWIIHCIADVLHLSAFQRAAVFIFWALNGVLVRFTTTVGNDALFWTLCGGLLLAALKLNHSDRFKRNILLFAALCIMALYTKLSALLLLPLPFIALRHQRSFRVLMSLAAVYVVIFFATLPIWLRNVHTFGSIIPLESGFGAAVLRFPNLFDAAYVVRSLIFPWHELWYGIVGLILMTPILCAMLWSLVSRDNRRLFVRTPVICAAALIVLLAYVWLNLRYDQAEARYLFAAWPVLAVGFSRFPLYPAVLWILIIVYLLPYTLMLLPLIG